jgi:heat-inducible transcriptional repressor
VTELNHRARQILYAAISEFVATGDPVGSRTLSKKEGIELSAASIRNVLADLEDMGYLQQPHTSAGRVPTDKAFRLFIDALMEVREISSEEHGRIREHLEAAERGGNVMRETGKLLVELTGTAAVVVTPRAEVMTLKHLRFIPTVPGELLAVIVMANGTVQNRFLRSPITEPELTRIHNLLDDVIEGRNLRELRELFARKLQTERVQHDELRRRAFELGEAAVQGTGSEVDVVIEGQSKLFDKPELAGGIKSVAALLDDRECLLRLLDATLEAKGTTVVVGKEAGELGGGQVAIVGASYTDRGQPAGTLAVIGPTRMDYAKVVPLVTATAHAVSAVMEGTRENDDDA